MINTKTFLLTCVLIFASFSGVKSEERILPAGYYAMPLAMQNGDARSMAMGSAFTAIAGGTSAILYNPAGLGVLEFAEISLNHNNAPGDLIREAVVMAVPMGDIGGFALSLNYSDNGVFEIRDDFGILSTEENRAYEASLAAGWGKQWLPGIFAGITFKTGRKYLGGNEFFYYTGDVGVLWKPEKSISIGAAYLNIGSMLGGTPGVSGVRAGVSYENKVFKNDSVIFAFSAESVPNGPSRLCSGIEFGGYSMPFLRVGYIYDFSPSQLAGLSGLTAGIGFKVKDFAFDYAFLPAGDLGNSHRVSLTYVTSIKAPQRQYLKQNDPRVISFETIYFDHEKSELNSDAREVLRKNIGVLKETLSTEVRIAAYTSKSGGKIFNLRLSEKRAIAIRNYLIREGDIAQDRVFIIWFGDSDPAAEEEDPMDKNSQAAKLNRRGLFQIIRQ